MENTITSNQTEKTKKTKFDLRFLFAVLTVGIVPVIFELLNAAAGDSLNTLAGYLYLPISELFDLFAADSFTITHNISDCLSSLSSLILLPLSVLITVTVCSLLLKSFTKGIAAYGISCIVFSIRKVLPVFLQTVVNLIIDSLFYYLRDGYYKYSEGISIATSVATILLRILDYSFYILCPVLIGLILFLSEKFQRKKPDVKEKLIIKLVLTGLVPVVYVAFKSLEMVLSLLQTNGISSYLSYAILTFVNTNLISFLTTLFLLVGLVIFITVFRDGKMFSAAIFYTIVPNSLIEAASSAVLAVILFIDTIAYTNISGFASVALTVLSIFLLILISALSFVFITVLPTVKAYKKELEEIKKAEEAEKADDSMQEYLDNIRFSEDMTDNYEYVYSENDEDNNEDYREISAEQYYSYE